MNRWLVLGVLSGVVVAGVVVADQLVDRGEPGAAPPSAVPHKHAASSAPARPPAPKLPFTFATTGYTAHPVPAAELPYAVTTPVPLVDAKPHDAKGVRMYVAGGKKYDHPVGQAQYGLANLDSYRLTHKAVYLQRALAQADRLLEKKVQSRGAWFYPYPYAFALHDIAHDTMRVPWYSGMAQGQALSLFVRLYQVTGDAAWRTAADRTAASFRRPRVRGLPSVVHVDGEHHLWIDEFPLSATRADLTFNGHNFAVFGLYDYVVLTGDAATARLFDGAVTTSLRYGTSGFRTPGWISHYCLMHKAVSDHYHGIHIEQLRNLYSMTADTRLAKLSDAYRADYPRNTSSTVLLAKGSHTGYRFDPSGAVIATRWLDLSAPASVQSSHYVRIKGRGRYLMISSGSLAGYYVADTPNVATAIGPYGTADYVPQRTARLPVGVTTGYRFGAKGLPSSSVRAKRSRVGTTSVSKSATYNGTRYVLVTKGALAGYWVQANRLTLL